MDSWALLTKMCNVYAMDKSYNGRKNPSVYFGITLAKMLVTFLCKQTNDQRHVPILYKSIT